MEDEKITLVNKFVKVKNDSEGVDNSGLIPFMYPNFIVKDEIFFDHNNSVIYTGKYHNKLREELTNGTKEFIALCDSGVPDIDFTNTEVIMKVLVSRHKRFAKNKADAMINMSSDDFWKLYKRLWVVNSSLDVGNTSSIFTLYEDLANGKARNVLLKDYFILRESYSDNAIFASLLSFIEKSLNPKSVSTSSGRYLKLLRVFQEKYGGRAQKVLSDIYRMEFTKDSDIDRQYRTMYLITQLGKESRYF